MAVLALIAGSIDVPSASCSVWSLKQDMEKAGYTATATTLALEKLNRSNLVSYDLEEGISFEEAHYCVKLTEAGMDYLLINQSNLVLTKVETQSIGTSNLDGIPF